jgi:hypothetical protein
MPLAASVIKIDLCSMASYASSRCIEDADCKPHFSKEPSSTVITDFIGVSTLGGQDHPMVLLTLISVIQALALEILWSKIVESPWL